MTLEELYADVREGLIDTVIVAMVDMQGRLVGKRVTARFFVDDVAHHGLHACSYLLGCDVEMEPLPGYRLTSWETGYHDVRLQPDLSTLRRLPWLEGTACVLCDVVDDSGVGVPVEFSKGEWGPGQHELNLRYTTPVEMADRHTLLKQAAKEIAALHQVAVSFMAKWRADLAGSSCHLHSSLWDLEAQRNLFWEEGATPLGMSPLFRHYLGGQLAGARELAYFFAPYVNSYKRYAAGTFAPVLLVWGHDNRTCGFRVVGRGHALRLENRIPGADVNPYLAFAATLAAGLWGIDHGLEPPAMFEGNAYAAPQGRPGEPEALPRVPGSLREAIAELERSEMAREAFGDRVVEHYLHTARLEQEAYDRAVTCWELARNFERI